MYVNRDTVLLDGRIAFLALILVFLSFGKVWFSVVFPPTFVYFVFYLAYATKYINLDEKLGDISYGIYIYARPIS